MNKTVAFLSGMVGGSFGLIASILVFIFEYEDAIALPVWLGLLFSVLAIAGSLVLRTTDTAGGIMLIIASIGVFMTVPMFNIISAILILIPGILGVTNTDQTSGS